MSRRKFLQYGLAGTSALALGSRLRVPGALFETARPARTVALRASAAQQAAGKLTLGAVGDIVNFDPYDEAAGNEPILENLNTYLIHYDANLNPQPAALTSWEFVSDHRSVTLHLRSGVKFQTGKECTAEDLVYGFQRAQNPETGGNLYSSMSIVSGIASPNAQTVVLTFHKPTADQIVTDLLSSFPVLDSRYNNSTDLAKAPCGAGPFRVVNRVPDYSLTLGRFEDYWAKGEPYLDTVVLQIFKDDNSLVSALQSGAVDGALNILAQDVNALSQEFRIVRGHTGTQVLAARISTVQPPFDNLKLRQAIQRCIDRQRALEVVQYGYGAPSALPWSLTSPAYDASYNEKYSFSLEAAKQLWKEAGSPSSGQALSSGAAEAANTAVLEILQADLEQIGFNLEIDEVDPATEETRLRSGDFGLIIHVVVDGNLSPWDIVANSCYAPADNPLWRGGTPPSSYVAAINALATAVTSAEQRAAYARVNEQLTELAWVLPVYLYEGLNATSKSVQGLDLDVNDRVMLAQTRV